MPVVKNPLFSELRGKIKSLEFRTRKNGKIELSMKRIPSYTRTAAQDKIRTRYGQLVQEWKQLTDEEKQEYRHEASKYRISGWNYFVMTKITVTGLSFDNGGGGTWNRYINIPITAAPAEYAQYKIELNADTINVYSADGTLKTQGTGMLDFWDNVKSDGSDIRAFDNNQQQLYFYIESFDYTNKTATIWVKVEAGITELNIAYGNAAATESAYNDPRQTFEVYDDFEDGAFDESYWNKNAIGTVTEANGVLTIQNTSSPQRTIIWSNKYIDYPVIIEAEAKGSSSRMGVAMVNPNGDYVIWHWLSLDNYNVIDIRKFSDNMTTRLANGYTTFTTAEGVYHYFRTTMNGHDIAGYVKNLNDGSENTVTFTTSAQYPTTGYVGLAAYNTVADYRYIRALKLADPASFGTPAIITI